MGMLLGRFVGNLSGDTPGKVPGEISGEIPGKAPVKISGNARGNGPGKISGKCLDLRSIWGRLLLVLTMAERSNSGGGNPERSLVFN